MKKLCSLLVTLSMLLAFGTVVASADDDYYQEAGYWIYDAPKMDEIMIEGAGIESTEWVVPYLDEIPTLDGTVEEDEYQKFEGFEDYISLMARIGNEVYGNTEEEFDYFRVQADTFGGAGGFIKPYWGWDGTYLYMAFEVQNLSGFHCTPQDTFYLFAYNCLQIGIGDEYTMGREFTELGFGVNSETGAPITHVWISDYQIQADDFGGKYDEDTGIVTYECRIKLVDTTIGTYLDEGENVEPGDCMKFAWLLSVNGANNRTSDTGEEGEEWQVAFCHGIGGQFSGKYGQYFALATFGAPEGEEIVTETEESETEAPETEATETETEAETPAESEEAPESETTAETQPAETTAETKAETKPADESGCASVITVGTGLSAVIAIGALTVLRKKED